MKWYIKLNGENIVGHIDSRHTGVDPNDYDATVNIGRLVDNEGNYKYKYVAGELVELSQNEIDNSELVLDNKDVSKFDKARELILTRVACDEVIGSAQAPQRLKDKAQSIKTTAGQELLELFS